MSKMFGIIKAYYDAGLWSKERVWNAVLKGKITEEEYHLIVDEPDAADGEGGEGAAQDESTDDADAPAEDDEDGEGE